MLVTTVMCKSSGFNLTILQRNVLLLKHISNTLTHPKLLQQYTDNTDHQLCVMLFSLNKW